MLVSKRKIFTLVVLFIIKISLSESAAQSPINLPPPVLKQDTNKNAPAPNKSEAPKKIGLPLPNVTISAKIEGPEVPVGQPIKLLIELSWTKSSMTETIPLLFDFPEPPSAKGLTLYANSFSSQTILKGGKINVIRSYKYEFSSENTGEYEISPVQVNYGWPGDEKKSNLATQPLKVKVAPPPFKLGNIIRHPAFAAILAFVLSIAAIALSWGKLKSGKQTSDEKEDEPTVHEKTRSRLNSIDRFRMAGDYDEFMLSLCREFNTYIEDTMKIRAKSSSTEKICQALSDKLGEKWEERTRAFYKLCSEVKFAGHIPSADQMDKAMETVTAIVKERERQDFSL
jgi:BatD DUF11 like domain